MVWKTALAGFAAILLIAATANAESDRKAFIDLIVNSQAIGEAYVIVRGSDALVKTEDLKRGGFRSIGGTRERLKGDEFVSLDSLSSTLTWHLDEQALTLTITAKPQVLGQSNVDFGSARPDAIEYTHDSSAFFNYAVNLRQFDQFDAFAEGGINIGHGLAYSSVFRNDQGLVVRGLTNFTIDHPERMSTLTAGDQLANTLDPLGGAPFIGGIGYSTNYSLDPYFTRFPTQSLSGALTTPSTVDVYVDGHLVRQELLPPGQFNLNNLPLTNGSGSTQVIVKDALGNQTQINSAYYQASQVLAEGLSDYSYRIGLRRNNVGTSSFDYSEPIFVARHRYGLTDSLTPGFRVELGRGLVSGGPITDLRLPFGTVELSLGASESQGRGGGAASLAYSYLSETFSVGGAAATMSDYYANSTLSPATDRARVQASAYFSLPLGANITVYPQYQFSEYRDAGLVDQALLSLSIRLGEKLSAFISLGEGHQPRGSAGPTALISLNYFLGNATTGSVSYQQQPHNSGPSLSIQKALPYGPGYGYRFETQTGQQGTQGSGTVQYQNDYGLYEADYGRVGNQDITALSAAGGVVAIGDRVFLTRPVEQGFALLRVPGVANVHGLLSNQDMGKTDSRGDLLIPNLLPYYGNILSVEPKDIPLDYEVGTAQKTIAPPNRGGAIVKFAVSRLDAFLGNLRVENAGRTVVPHPGQITVKVNGSEYVSPIGKNGEFYLENVPAGSHEALIEDDDGGCHFTIDFPDSKDPIVKLGTLTCQQSRETAAR